LLVLASLPAAAAGLLLKPVVEAAFGSPAAVCGFLLVTAVILMLGERVGRRTRGLHDLRAVDALWIGLAQAVSLFPGISRSGATIAGGLARHLQRPGAARFSFLMSVPVLIGAGLVAVNDLAAAPVEPGFLTALVAGTATAAVSGYFAIRWLLGYLARRSLTVFAAYCAAVGLAGLAVGVLRG
jgi:undecaprenyl-diphosphatase